MEILDQARNLPLERLFLETAAVRERAFGRSVEVCMIANAKCGRCANDCAFCTQSAHHGTQVEVFPLVDAETLLAEARIAERAGASRFGIVTGGATVDTRELVRIAETIRAIGNACNLRVCASLGTLTDEQLAFLKDAGLSRYHHNLETSESFYPRICTTQTWRSRFETVRHAKEAGLETCSGALFGMGENWDERKALAESLRELGVESVPINFLDPRPGTPLAGHPLLDAEEALRIIALFRLVLPRASLRVCGGRTKILRDRQPELVAAGADAIMSGNYLTTGGATPERDRAMIESLGLEIGDWS